MSDLLRRGLMSLSIYVSLVWKCKYHLLVYIWEQHCFSSWKDPEIFNNTFFFIIWGDTSSLISPFNISSSQLFSTSFIMWQSGTIKALKVRGLCNIRHYRQVFHPTQTFVSEDLSIYLTASHEEICMSVCIWSLYTDII